jgi:hypothetical protein
MKAYEIRVATEEWSMVRVEASFRDRESLLRLQHGAGEGVLFIPDFTQPSVGSPILVRVSATGLPTGLFVEGVVAWRRLAPAGAYLRGLGVRVLSQHMDRLLFLRRWTHGEVLSVPREHWRFPCREPVLVSFNSAGRKATQRFVHGTLEDVSERGALLVTPSPLPTGGELYVDIPSVPGAPFSARVAWSAGTRAGLERVASSATETAAAWMQFVERAARAVEPEARIES